MDLLLACLLFAGIFAIYNALRILNNNIIEQTEEIRKLRKSLNKDKN
jgi:hypothetical protein